MPCFLIVFFLLSGGIAQAQELTIPAEGKQVNQLHDELLAAFPIWKGTKQPDGRFINPLFSVQSTATEIILTFPDATDLSAVQAVIAAHTVKAPPLDQEKELEAAIAQATTLAELKDALLGKTRQGKVSAERP